MSAANVVLLVECRIWAPYDRPFQPEWIDLSVIKEHTVFGPRRHQLPDQLIAVELAHQQRALSGAAHGPSRGLVHVHVTSYTSLYVSIRAVTAPSSLTELPARLGAAEAR